MQHLHTFCPSLVIDYTFNKDRIGESPNQITKENLPDAPFFYEEKVGVIYWLTSDASLFLFLGV